MDTNNIKQYMNTTEDRFFELMFTSYLSDFQKSEFQWGEMKDPEINFKEVSHL